MTTATITQHQAELISSMFHNAGWEDDADELLGDLSTADAIEVAQNMLALCDVVNSLLPEDEHIGNDLRKELAYIKENI